MCSVTFWPTDAGYRLAMNRDELRSRAPGLPPAQEVVGARRVVHPRDPAGGTWISLNDLGVTFALLNWYAVTSRASLPAVSRGEVVLALRSSASAAEAGERLRSMNLARVNPFRLLGFDPAAPEIREWRWDLASLTEEVRSWAPTFWASSGHDEPGAQRERTATFERWRTRHEAGSWEWLRRLHGSHETERGPYSVCMHRADATTVSYTEVQVEHGESALRYHAGAPCGSTLPWPSSAVALGSSPSTRTRMRAVWLSGLFKT